MHLIFKQACDCKAEVYHLFLPPPQVGFPEQVWAFKLDQTPFFRDPTTKRKTFEFVFAPTAPYITRMLKVHCHSVSLSEK